MKNLKESLLDDVDSQLNNFGVIDLYTLIKDKIKALTYNYRVWSYSHALDINKCISLSDSNEILKTIDGQTLKTGKEFGRILPLFLKQIIVEKNFINKRDDDSYLKSSAEQTWKFISDNKLTNDREYYIYVEMRKGVLNIYYDIDSPDINRSIQINPKTKSRGDGYVRIKLIK